MIYLGDQWSMSKLGSASMSNFKNQSNALNIKLLDFYKIMKF